MLWGETEEVQASYTRGLTDRRPIRTKTFPGVIKIFPFHTENEPWLKAYEHAVVPIFAKWIPLRAGILALGRPLEVWCSNGNSVAEAGIWVPAAQAQNKGSLRTGLCQQCIPSRKREQCPHLGGLGTIKLQLLQLLLGCGVQTVPGTPLWNHLDPRTLIPCPYFAPTDSSHERNGFRVSICYPKASHFSSACGENHHKCPEVHVSIFRWRDERRGGLAPPHPV